MFNWIRSLPHFGYGKCGGKNRDCSISNPRDWMDLAFEEHDINLEEAEKFQTEVMRKAARKHSDKILGKALREGDPKKLKLYGKFYRLCAMLIFR